MHRRAVGVWLLCILGVSQQLAFAHLSHGNVYLRTGKVRIHLEDQYRPAKSQSRSLLQVKSACQHPAWSLWRDNQQLMVHYNNSHSSVQHQLLEQIEVTGAVISAYLPDNTWLVIGDADKLHKAAEKEHLLWLGEYKPEYRIAPEWQHIQAASSNASHYQLLVKGHAVHDVASKAGSSPAHHIGALRFKPALTGSDTARLLIEVHFSHIATEDLQRLKLRAEYDPVKAALADWPEPLAQLTSAACAPQLHAERGLLLVSACPQHLQAVLEWLSQQPAVHWLAPHMQQRLHNVVAGAITQGVRPASVSSALSADAHPLWRVGLDGTGQVVGCGDSGIDLDSCYFWDPQVDISSKWTRERTTGANIFESTEHRKIRMYLALEDNIDNFGHGTHVGGTIVGSSYLTLGASTPDVATGVAPGAKISFIDLSRENSDSVWTPGDLSNNYFDFSYQRSARIHSDSWGSDSTAYDFLAYSVDMYTWKNQDFLSLFAAGNFGSQQQQTTTITSPATCKNAIAVGAALSMIDSYQATTSAPVFVMTVSISAGGQTLETRAVKVVQAGFAGSFKGLEGRTFSLVAAAPEDACSSLGNALITNNILLARRSSGCPHIDKARNGQSAGAAGVVITNNIQEGYFAMTATGSVGLPVGGVPLSIGRYLWDALYAQRTITVSFVQHADNEASYEDIAYFSSFGPTLDGRVKPDIVAPGVLTSAGSDKAYSKSVDSSCRQSRQQGTSMATPVVAGSAALVRQYFLDGYYPTGTKGDTPGYDPSGVLVKAMLLAGASAMQGISEARLPLEDPPSFRQGYGRVNLSQTLPLAGAGAGWKLQVVDKSPIQQGESHRYCITSTGGPLKVLLAWYDYPADPNSNKALVNNLDLQVRAAALQGTTLLGNGFADDINTNEMVSVDLAAPGNVEIMVNATRVFAKASPQKYSLVVVGRFSGVLQSPYNPVGASNATTGACVVNAPVIDSRLSVPSLTSKTDVPIYFSSPVSVASSVGYQCRLTDQEGKTSTRPHLHDWKACSSPAIYTTLQDGSYIFLVKAKGEDFASSLPFTVDSTPPQTQLQSTLPAAAATAADNVTFAFSASDMSLVKFACRFAPSDGASQAAEKPAYLRLGSGDIEYDKNFACTSPVTILGLSYGDWKFMVTGTDAAGNVEISSPSRTWQTRYEPGVSYTRATSGPYGPTNTKALTYNLIKFVGGSDGKATGTTSSAAFECALQPQNGSAAAASWQPCTSPATLRASTDGKYLFQARISGGGRRRLLAASDTIASIPVEVDTTPPVVNITSQPDAKWSNPTATVQYQTIPPDDAKQYMCRWVKSADASSPNPDAREPDFTDCEGPKPGTAQKDVEDGYWLFQVKGIDAVGNVGNPAKAEFQTDTTPPNITLFDTPTATQNHTVTVQFKVDDGPLGFGVNPMNISCRLRGTFVNANSSAQQQTAAGALQPSDSWRYKCESPVVYGLQEGKYALSIQATDEAKLRTQKDFAIVVDNTPPVASLMTGVFLAPQPPQVTLQFQGKDLPDGSPSGIVQYQCMLARTDAAPTPPAASDTASANNTTAQVRYTIVPLNGTKRLLAAASPAGFGARSRRRLLARPAWHAIKGGPNVTLSEWVNCTGGQADPITYIGLRNGQYSFAVRAVDAAGNVGSPSVAAIFTVDESLLTPEEQAERDAADRERLRRIIIAVICVLGLVSAVGVSVGVVLLRKRWLRKLREPPRTMFAYDAGGGARGAPRAAAAAAAAAAAGGDPALEAALRQSRVEYEEKKRVEAAIVASYAEYQRQKQRRQQQQVAAVAQEGLLEGSPPSQEHLLARQQQEQYSSAAQPPAAGGRSAAQLAAEEDERRLQLAIEASLREVERQRGAAPSAPPADRAAL